MKFRRVVVSIILIFLITGFRTNSLALEKDKIQDTLTVFKKIIVDENWYKGNYSYFDGLRGKEVSYELYDENYKKKNKIGEIGNYYLLIKEKNGYLKKVSCYRVIKI